VHTTIPGCQTTLQASDRPNTISTRKGRTDMAYRDNEYCHITQCHMSPYNAG